MPENSLLALLEQNNNIRGRRCRPLSVKISSPNAINWTLKQYGYTSSTLYFIKQDHQIATIDIQKV
jgi:hypothetical protein